MISIKGIPGEAKITFRMGDVYFGKVLQKLPNLPQIYRRLLPENYENLITDDERTVEFLCIGTPKNKGIKEDSLTGKLAIFFIDNKGEEFNIDQLDEFLKTEDMADTATNLSYNFKSSQCFNLSITKKGIRAIYSLEELEPSKEYLDQLKKIDKELGI